MHEKSSKFGTYFCTELCVFIDGQNEPEYYSDRSQFYYSYSSFSIIRYFLPNPGRILPALVEKSKIKIVPSRDWTHNLQIFILMLYQLS